MSIFPTSGRPSLPRRGPTAPMAGNGRCRNRRQSGGTLDSLK